jgi:hypothetical protein
MAWAVVSGGPTGHFAHLESATVRPHDALSPFNKPLLVPHKTSNLDHIASNVVLQHLESLHRTSVRPLDRCQCVYPPAAR